MYVDGSVSVSVGVDGCVGDLVLMNVSGIWMLMSLFGD